MIKRILTVGSLSQLDTFFCDQPNYDVLEVRLDIFGYDPKVHEVIESNQLPLLITARDTREGGQNALSIEERIELLINFAPFAQFIDVEIANLEEYAPIQQLDSIQSTLKIASYHNFSETPSYEFLCETLEKAKAYDVDIVKFAVATHTLDDLLTCQRLLLNNPDDQIAIMGMGELGPISRVFLAQSGSVLNYGYVGNTETAPGQWPAGLLKSAIENSSPIKDLKEISTP